MEDYALAFEDGQAADSTEAIVMVLLLNNKDVEQVLSIKDCMDAIEEVYQGLAAGEAANFPPSAVVWKCMRQHLASSPIGAQG